jgi:RNA polymerase sigma factor (sigma-70 family)
VGRSEDGLDLVRVYLRQIEGEALLTKEEEVSLARAVERGRIAAEELARQSETLTPERRRALEELAAEGERSRQQFVRANLRLVVAVARQWTASGLPLLDLIQEGNLGLLRAVERFDWRRGFRFSTYATWWIRQAITRAVANSGRLVRLPVHTGEALHRLLREVRRLEQERGGPAPLDLVAASSGLRAEQVSRLLRHAPEPVSISEPIGDAQYELGTVLADASAPSPADTALAGLLPAEIDRLLGILDADDRKVLALRFGLGGDEPRTLEAVGQALGLSREEVRHSQARALRALRRAAVASPQMRDLLAG